MPAFSLKQFLKSKTKRIVPDWNRPTYRQISANNNSNPVGLQQVHACKHVSLMRCLFSHSIRGEEFYSSPLFEVKNKILNLFLRTRINIALTSQEPRLLQLKIRLKMRESILNRANRWEINQNFVCTNMQYDFCIQITFLVKKHDCGIFWMWD